MFYFFIKWLFSVLTKRKMIYILWSAYRKFTPLRDSQTTLLMSFWCFIVLWKHTCWPIKTHVLSKLFYKSLTMNKIMYTVVRRWSKKKDVGATSTKKHCWTDAHSLKHKINVCIHWDSFRWCVQLRADS